jgi:hypothetical protein
MIGLRRALAAAYLVLGVVLGAYALADPVWGFPSCLVLGGWLIFLATRCLGQGDLAAVLRRTAGVYAGIAGAGVVLLIYSRVQGTGPSEGVLAARISFPTFLITVCSAVALLSWVALRRLTPGTTAPGGRGPRRPG